MKAPLPDRESQRISQLLQYEILNQTSQAAFEDFTRLAALTCGTPMAAISIVGSNRQWFKSSVGWSVQETPRDVAFCAHAIYQPDRVLVVPDATADERFATNPLVTGEPYLRFYAGAPLTTAKGLGLGTLCVMDRVPRQLTAEQAEALQLLSGLIIKQLDREHALAYQVLATNQVNAALRESEQRYTSVLDNIQEVVFQTDAQGSWTFLSAAWTEMTGFSLAESIGTNSLDYIHPDDRSRYRKLFESRSENNYHSLQVRYVTKQNNYHWFEAHVCQITDSENSLSGLSGTLNDITEHKRAEEALRVIQERYELAVSAGEVGVWDWNIVTDEVYIDPMIKNALGYTDLDIPNTLSGWRSLIHPDDIKRVEAATIAHLQAGLPYDVEHRRVHKDGSIRWFLSRGTALADAEDKLYRMTGTDTDITDRKRTQEALERERRQLQQIIASAPVAMAMLDKGLRYIAYSQKWLEDYGLKSRSIVGRNLYQILPDIPERWKAICQQALQGKAMSSPEDVWERADGSKIYLRWAIEPWRNVAGEVAGIVIVTDLINQLVAAREEALEASRFKSQFLANMSHEIRTPMNAVIGMTGLLLDTQLNAEQRDFVETIRISGDALLTLINEILDLSKLEAGDMELEILDFDLSTCIGEVLELLAANAHAKGLEVAGLIDPKVPTHLRGDPGRLRQILMNLTGNAIKFTSKGEVVIRAELLSETPTTANIRIAVVDTGIGIAPEKQGKLFSAFTQVDASTSRKFGGTGLGLAICKELVTLWGGEIGIKSQLNQGSEFWFTLPFSKQTKPKTEVADVSYLTGRRLLVVDDNATNRKVVRYQVAPWGMICDEAENATVAYEMLEQAAQENNLYDLVMIDMQMPEIDGMTLGSQVKANPTLAQVPLVMFTSTDRRDKVRHALDIGFAAYLVKPIKASRLFDTIMTVLAEPDLETAKALIQSSSYEPESQQDRPTAKLKILLAEDNLVNQKVALKQLESLGYKADVAANGSEVLKLLEKVPYDLILMDCQMPILDGYDTTREIHRLYSQPPAIVAMTANAMKEDVEKCLNAGMDDYLSKPVSKAMLAAALERWSCAHKSADAPIICDRAVPDTEETLEMDWELLHQLSDNDPEFELELLQLFGQTANTYLEVLREAIASHDFEEIKKEAHKLKGSSGNIGAKSIHLTARKLEEMARKQGIEECSSLLTELENYFNGFQSIVRDLESK